MTLKNARRRAAMLGYEVDKGRVRKYRFKRIGAFRWIDTDDLDAMLIHMGQTAHEAAE